jgi:tricarboxylate carrier
MSSMSLTSLSLNPSQTSLSSDDVGLSKEALWAEKYKYDSAFHPQTGAKMFLPGRMSAWVPSNMLITGAMLSFQHNPTQVIFWQFANQAVNATVNYTNRSGGDISNADLARNFALATSSAVAVALFCKKFTPAAGFVSRLSPFVAVCVANGCNTSLMRKNELDNGVAVSDANGVTLGHSQIAAKRAVQQVVLQRVACAIPAMVFPLAGQLYIEKKFPAIARSRILSPVSQVALVGLGLLVGNPLTCALFRQQSPISSDELELEFRQMQPAQTLFYNKGL